MDLEGCSAWEPARNPEPNDAEAEAEDSDSSMPNTLRDRLKSIKLTPAVRERKRLLVRLAGIEHQKAELEKAKEHLKCKRAELVELKEAKRVLQMQNNEIVKLCEFLLEILHERDGNDTSFVSLATNDDCCQKEIQLLKAKNDSLERENKLLNLERRILLEQKRIDILENKRHGKEVLSCSESRGLEENQLLKTENRVLMERLKSYEADKNRQQGESSNQWPA